MWIKANVANPSGTKVPRRCYKAEHVLEWQLLRIFLEENKDKDAKSRCTFLHRHSENDLPQQKYKVQASKDKEKLTNNHFDYGETDYAFDGK